MRAYAKVNLGLELLGRREDGYHNIRTLIQRINFSDNLSIDIIDKGIYIKTNHPPYGKANICYMAAKLFFKKTGIREGVSIRLVKNIWDGAGLGGASSDAASLLLSMNRLFGNPMSLHQLKEFSLSIGSDVPFFLDGNLALIEGRGEIVKKIKDVKDSIYLVLIYPGFPISTSWAYKNVKELPVYRDSYVNRLVESIKNGKPSFSDLRNDFEQLAFEKYPILYKIKERLLQFGCVGASLTGSGSVVYGIDEKKETEEIWRERFHDLNTEVKCVKTIV